jgi:hypothetical protein
VSESSSLLPFAWVHKRDGRLVPFEADKISRALFAATESLGRPDAFLARELTDGILHFLAADAGGAPPTTAQVAEMVVKVVRELGQPALAQAFAEGEKQKARKPLAAKEVPLPQQKVHRWVEDAPLPVELAWRIAAATLREETLGAVFARDLVAVQAAGLLTLTGLEAPLELAGCVLGVPGPDGLLAAVVEAREVAGNYLAVDGPEWLLAQGVASGSAVYFARQLVLCLHATGLRAIVNLNCATAPPWAEDLAEGPLFAGHRRPPAPERLTEFADALREQFLPSGGLAGRLVRLDWHLGERDFTPAGLPALTRLARWVLDGAALTFVFDRPRRPIALAEGLDRQHGAVLMAVGLHLPRLAEQLPADAAPEAFLKKLGSLARLALSAAVQKRDFLRRHSANRPALTRGFLLDRARLIVTPVGVGTVMARWGGMAEFGREVLQRLHTALRQDGLACRLETAVGYLPPGGVAADLEPEPLGPVASGRAALAAAKQQLRARDARHGGVELGSVTVSLSVDSPPTPEELAGLLRYVWQQTEVVRLAFRRAAVLPRQLTAPWEEGAGAE